MNSPRQNLIEFDALGTHWWIESLETPLSNNLQETIRDHVNTFEQSYTRFSDSSLLGQLNSSKQLSEPPQEMIAMLEFARNMQGQSKGVFNISVGGTLQKLGYGRLLTRGSVTKDFWNKVKLTPYKVTIPSEISLDFGGFGKGWLIDSIGELLKREGVPHYIINGGGDILINASRPLEFALEHPHDSSKAIGNTKFQKGALAVSSTIKRSWQKDGQKHHHIIDPRTGKPSQSGIITTYVRAETALIADTCATILLIAPELEPEFTKTHHLKTIILSADQLTS